MKAALFAIAIAAISAPAFAGVLVSSNGNPVKTIVSGTCVRVMNNDIPSEFYAACGIEIPSTK